MNAGHHRDILPDPDIVANDGIAFERQIFQSRSELLPAASHDVKGISRYAAHPMVCTVHYKFSPFCNGAKLSDDQLISQEWVVMRHMVFKPLRTVHIVIVGVIANEDVGSCDHILDKNNAFDCLVR